MADELLNPLGFGTRASKALAPRLATLQGKTIGLLDIGFPNGNLSEFFTGVVDQRNDTGMGFSPPCQV